jgi:hypothetical protein
MARNLGTDQHILEAALVGYQVQRDIILAKIEEIKAHLGTGATRKVVAPAAPAPRKAHKISPEGLKRIRDAQKRRWAAAKAKAVTA